tara:strand:- start:2043 stop:2678 length:636 start_codon:yes stop_codon:yes gene_type:complete
MDSNPKGSGTRTPYTTPLRLHPDAKKGLGYGVVEPTGFNRPRNAPANFPYLDPDPYAEGDLNLSDVLSDDELDTFVTKINRGYLPSDFLAAADPFYFVAGNTPLNVHESAAQADNTDPDPPPYHGRKHGPLFRAGAAFPYPGGGGTSYKRTGTVSGFSHSPPPLAIDPGLGQYAVYNLRDMPDKDERTLFKLRALIADIIRQQEYSANTGK